MENDEIVLNNEEQNKDAILTQQEGFAYPVLPLRGIVLFPFTTESLHVGRDISVKAVEYATTQGDGKVLLVIQKLLLVLNSLFLFSFHQLFSISNLLNLFFFLFHLVLIVYI